MQGGFVTEDKIVWLAYKVSGLFFSRKCKGNLSYFKFLNCMMETLIIHISTILRSSVISILESTAVFQTYIMGLTSSTLEHCFFERLCEDKFIVLREPRFM